MKSWGLRAAATIGGAASVYGVIRFGGGNVDLERRVRQHFGSSDKMSVHGCMTSADEGTCEFSWAGSKEELFAFGALQVTGDTGIAVGPCGFAGGVRAVPTRGAGEGARLSEVFVGEVASGGLKGCAVFSL